METEKEEGHHGMNVTFKQLTDNIRQNVVYGPPLDPHAPLQGGRAAETNYLTAASPAVHAAYREHMAPLILLGGGPSINWLKPVLRPALREPNVRVVTVNAAYGWALSNGFVPNMQVMVDARPENAEMLSLPAPPQCQYLLASQVHPDVVAQVPPKQVAFWHNDASTEVRGFIKRHDTRWAATKNAAPFIGGGLTVMLRSLHLLHIAGWDRISIFGMDCGWTGEDTSHGYAQEPDGEVLTYDVGGRPYHTTAWMLAQAQDFYRLMKGLPSLRVCLFGDTLLAKMMQRDGAGLPNVFVSI